jgi:pimeloyl-ACP methyl ester carboxylesterase
VIFVFVGLAAAAAGLLGFTALVSRVIEARFPPVGERVTAGPRGAAVHVVERPPSAPERGAVLLVHGASGNFADLEVALGDRLAALGFRVLAVDRPGHGWSERLAGADMADRREQDEAAGEFRRRARSPATTAVARRRTAPYRIGCRRSR